MNGSAGTDDNKWASAKARSEEVNGYPSFSTRNQGFFSRHARRISTSLPTFSMGGRRDFSDKEKLGRGRWPPINGSRTGRFLSTLGRLLWRLRLRLGIVLCFILAILLFYVTRESHVFHHGGSKADDVIALHRVYRRASWLGGGNKFVIILAANQGGGVMEWKGAREWAIERDSVRNKKKYAKKWGYDLEIVDMSTKKRYAHEWRESWEKVDTIRNSMRKYPKAEW
jgi:mannan polymerase II complex MNN10 subunit